MPKNQRPICLLSVIFKLLQKLLLKRLEYRLECYQSKMQMAFRKNRSTQKSLFIRKHMLKAEHYQDPTVKIIEGECDIESAYPSRIHTCTNNHLLKFLGKDDKLLHLIIEFYKDSNC